MDPQLLIEPQWQQSPQDEIADDEEERIRAALNASIEEDTISQAPSEAPSLSDSENSNDRDADQTNLWVRRAPRLLVYTEIEKCRRRDYIQGLKVTLIIVGLLCLNIMPQIKGLVIE